MKLIGMTFGRLTALSETRIGNKRRLAYVCFCACGIEKTVLKENLTSGRQVSCGCWNKEKSIGNKNGIKHGMHKTRTYSIWRTMRERCNLPSHGAYSRYGKKGISVCERWNDFNFFLADMGECPDNCTIDRIDSKGNYETNNCRWATMKEQQNNRSNNRHLTVFGETKTVSEWADIYKVNKNRIYERLNKGITDPQQLFKQPRSYKK